MTRKYIEFAPFPVLNRAVRKALDNNWASAHVVLQKNDVKRGSSVISSHFVYKLKRKENDKLRLEERLYPHANRKKNTRMMSGKTQQQRCLMPAAFCLALQ